jgi:tripeptide aminopeptidase
MKDVLEERFLRYVRINTQSDPDSKTYPSSSNQKILASILADELKNMGVNVLLDEYGYVIARIPPNTKRKVSPLFFCSHLDTSPDCTAENVKPIVYRNYNGSDIVMPADRRQIIRIADFPSLGEKKGMDIITADGTTLLGADNKAGLAELMEAANQLILNPEIKPGEIIIVFVPDEEIGKDTVHLTPEIIGAKYGYSVDGHELATINDQTFCVGNASVEITGATIHTGKGGGLMQSAIKIITEIIQKIPSQLSPGGATEEQSFIHPFKIEGKPGTLKAGFQLRAFSEEELKDLSTFLYDQVSSVMSKYARSTFTYDFEIKDSNIKDILKNYPFLIEVAREAMIKADLVPIVKPLRGSTTGASLAKMGLPCPNIFTGQHGVHGKLEWICLQDMVKAVETILNICQVWEQRGL